MSTPTGDIGPKALDKLLRAAYICTRAGEPHSADIIEAFAYGRYGLGAVLLTDTKEMRESIDRLLALHPAGDLMWLAESHVRMARGDMVSLGDGQVGGFEKVMQMLGLL